MTKTFMTFYLGGMEYGIELEKVREILTYPELITELPNTAEFVKGLINLRGEVVPLIDLRIKFSIHDEVIYDENTAVLAVVTNDGRMLGIVVDRVEDTKDIDLSVQAPISEIGSAIPSKYLKGLVQNEGEMLVLMDIESILNKEELE